MLSWQVYMCLRCSSFIVDRSSIPTATYCNNKCYVRRGRPEDLRQRCAHVVKLALRGRAVMFSIKIFEAAQISCVGYQPLQVGGLSSAAPSFPMIQRKKICMRQRGYGPTDAGSRVCTVPWHCEVVVVLRSPAGKCYGRGAPNWYGAPRLKS